MSTWMDIQQAAESRGAFWRNSFIYGFGLLLFTKSERDPQASFCKKKKKKKIEVSQAPVSRGSEFVNSGLRFFWMQFDMSDVRHAGSFSIWRKSIVRRLKRQMGKKRVLFYGEDEIIHRHFYNSFHVAFKSRLWPDFHYWELEGAAVDEEAAKPVTTVQDCASTIGRTNVHQLCLCKKTEKFKKRTHLYVVSFHVFRSSFLFLFCYNAG